MQAKSSRCRSEVEVGESRERRANAQSKILLAS